jgi:hypothetical protein
VSHFEDFTGQGCPNLPGKRQMIITSGFSEGKLEKIGIDDRCVGLTIETRLGKVLITIWENELKEWLTQIQAEKDRVWCERNVLRAEDLV